MGWRTTLHNASSGRYAVVDPCSHKAALREKEVLCAAAKTAPRVNTEEINPRYGISHHLPDLDIHLEMAG